MADDARLMFGSAVSVPIGGKTYLVSPISIADKEEVRASALERRERYQAERDKAKLAHLSEVFRIAKDAPLETQRAIGTQAASYEPLSEGEAMITYITSDEGETHYLWCMLRGRQKQLTMDDAAKIKQQIPPMEVARIINQYSGGIEEKNSSPPQTAAETTQNGTTPIGAGASFQG